MTVGVKFEPQQIYKTLFAPARSELAGSSDMYHFLRAIVTLQSYLIMLLLGASVLVSFVFADKNIYHLVVLDRAAFPKQVKRLVPLDEPNLTRTAITNMAMHIATQVQSYGFNNADTRLLQAKRLFTEDAWFAFASAHLKPGHLDTFKENQQILSTIASNQAVIVAEGRQKGVYRWVVELPFISSYLAGKESSSRNGTLRLTLIRASTVDYPEGVAISGWRESGG